MNKENYLKNNNLEDLARKWLSHCSVRGILDRQRIAFDRSALLVVDAQDFFFSKESHAFVPSSPHIQDNIETVIGLFRRYGRPIAFCYHAESRTSPAFPMDHLWGGVLYEDSPLVSLSRWLPIENGDFVFRKTRFSAFYKTNFDFWLQEQGLRNLYLAGVTTNVCVESSARDAFMYGFLPIVVADATAAWNERQHARSLEAVSEGFGWIGTLSMIEEGLP